MRREWIKGDPGDINIDDIQDDVFYEIEALQIGFSGKFLKSPVLLKMLSRRFRAQNRPAGNEPRPYIEFGPGIIRYQDNPPGYIIHQNFNGMRKLISDLDLPKQPDSVYYSTFFEAEEFVSHMPRRSLAKYQKYTVHAVGIEIFPPASQIGGATPLPDASQYTCPPKYWRECGVRLIQIWRLRIFSEPFENIQTSLSEPFGTLPSTAIYLEECWHPRANRTRTLFGLENVHHYRGMRIQEFYEDAVKILEDEVVIGRPPGTGEFRSREQFVDALIEAYRAASNGYKIRPTQLAVAEKLIISPATLRHYMRRKFEVPWPPNRSI